MPELELAEDAGEVGITARTAGIDRDDAGIGGRVTSFCGGDGEGEGAGAIACAGIEAPVTTEAPLLRSSSGVIVEALIFLPGGKV